MIGTNVDLGLGLRNSDYIERRWVGAKLLSATGLAHVYREEVGNVEKRNDVRTVPLRLFLFLCWFPSVAGFPFFFCPTIVGASQGYICHGASCRRWIGVWAGIFPDDREQ
jgi:hypothetical protein